MNIGIADLEKDIDEIINITNKAFFRTPDADLSNWFSFSEMKKMVDQNTGLCLKAIDENNKIIGMICAQQESLINGKEGKEKWVIVITAVDPNESGKGTGSKLLEKLEEILKKREIKKLFVYTNKEDEKVINFYKQNNYEDAGWIKDYQYGQRNSAIFLLKYLQN
jgi:ribosomal protein S18 acetylase RimI-like enzyme